MLPHAEMPEGNDSTGRCSRASNYYLRASKHVVEPEIRDVNIVSAHFEICPIKYSNLEYEGKTPK